MDYASEPRGVFLMIDNKSFYATVECTSRGLDPLTTPLVVMSEADNTGSGLILASSPAAKQLFKLHNVNRARDLPNDDRLLVVPPRMNLYIEKNLAINDIFSEFVAQDDLLPYSIDESILDLTHSWRLYGDNILAVVRRIQREVYQRLHLVTTIGIGNNPVQAKLALDIYAKHNPEFIGVITNQTARARIWAIKDLTSVWGINTRMAARLERLGIHTMWELAHADPYFLEEKLGKAGARLYATAWGVDHSSPAKSHRHKKKSESVGNSQVLPRDYHTKEEIELVISEITAQVASRLRAKQKQAGGVYLGIGYALGVVDDQGKTGFTHSQKLAADTADTRVLMAEVKALFERSWRGQPVRHVAVAATRLTKRYGEQLDLFATKADATAIDVENTVDAIRKRYGKTAIVRAASLKKGGTFIARSKLVGGHTGGQSLE